MRHVFIDAVAGPLAILILLPSPIAGMTGAVCGDPAWIAVPRIAISAFLTALLRETGGA